ncbi:Hypothetical protein POVN_LOCUS391 [uncultured virus]|nr:Hypothetical protein POVN_LOCUS391 [uncultured virus]
MIRTGAHGHDESPAMATKETNTSEAVAAPVITMVSREFVQLEDAEYGSPVRPGYHLYTTPKAVETALVGYGLGPEAIKRALQWNGYREDNEYVIRISQHQLDTAIDPYTGGDRDWTSPVDELGPVNNPDTEGALLTCLEHMHAKGVMPSMRYPPSTVPTYNFLDVEHPKHMCVHSHWITEGSQTRCSHGCGLVITTHPSATTDEKEYLQLHRDDLKPYMVPAPETLEVSDHLHRWVSKSVAHFPNSPLAVMLLPAYNEHAVPQVVGKFVTVPDQPKVALLVDVDLTVDVELLSLSQLLVWAGTCGRAAPEGATPYVDDIGAYSKKAPLHYDIPSLETEVKRVAQLPRVEGKGWHFPYLHHNGFTRDAITLTTRTSHYESLRKVWRSKEKVSPPPKRTGSICPHSCPPCISCMDKADNPAGLWETQPTAKLIPGMPTLQGLRPRAQLGILADSIRLNGATASALLKLPAMPQIAGMPGDKLPLPEVA